MARTNRKVAAKAANTNDTDMKAAVNKVLEESKNKFDGILVIGMTDEGNIDINSNVTQYAWLHYVMKRAGFELLIHEKNQISEKNSVAVQSEAEAS